MSVEQTRGALRAIKILPSAPEQFLLSIVQFLRYNGTNTSAFTSIHLTTRLNLLYPPLIPSSLVITTRRLLTAAETASTCNFMKAFTVHATNSAQRYRLRPAAYVTYSTYVRPTTYVPCKSTFAVRDAHRAIPLRATSRPSSTFYFTPVRRPKSANKHSLRFLLSKRDRNNRVSFSVSYHFTIISHFFLSLPPFLSFFCFLFSSRVC